MAHDPTALVLQPGEFGVIVRSNRDIDLVVAQGEEEKPLADMPMAFLGAALTALSDPESTKLFKERFLLATSPVNKVAA